MNGNSTVHDRIIFVLQLPIQLPHFNFFLQRLMNKGFFYFSLRSSHFKSFPILRSLTQLPLLTNMMLFALNLVFFCAFTGVGSIRIGIIQNASLLTNCSHLTMNALTCNECSCTMLYSSKNVSILSLNCYVNNSSSVSCELFTAATYLSSCSYQMKNNSNSTFYFQQLPSSNPSATAAMATIQTVTGREFVLVTFHIR
jgi:hypothetical protein